MISIWEHTTKIELCLILVLIIAIPFLIGMIIVYIILSYVPDSILCKDYCTYHPKEIHTVSSISRRIAENPKQCPDDNNNNRKQYSSIGHILEKLYLDDNYEYLIKGPCALLSNKWCITTEDCISAYSEPNNLKIRLYTKNWSKNGKLFNIIEVLKSPQYYNPSKVLLLRINNWSEETCHLKSVTLWKNRKILNVIQLTNLTTFHYFYKNANLSRPLSDRIFHSQVQTYKMNLVSLDSNSICYNNIVGQYFQAKDLFCGFSNSTTCEDDIYHSPLLSHIDNTILGISVGSFCFDDKRMFVYDDISRFIPWLIQFQFK